MGGSSSSLSRRDGLLCYFLNGGRAIFFFLQRIEPFSILCRRATYFSLNKRGWFFVVKRTMPNKRRRFSYLKWGKSHSLLSDRDRPISNTIYKGIRFPLLSLEKREPFSPFKVETVLSSLERKGPLSSHRIIDGDSVFLSEAITVLFSGQWKRIVLLSR